MYQHLDEIIQIIHESSLVKLKDLALVIADKHESNGGYAGGIVHKGTLITPYNSVQVSSFIYKANEKTSDDVNSLAEKYLSLNNIVENKSQKIRQLLGLLYLKCSRKDDLFVNNLPYVLVQRILEGRPETPKALYFKEAKASPLFWDQYKIHVVDYVHFTFGSELIM